MDAWSGEPKTFHRLVTNFFKSLNKESDDFFIDYFNNIFLSLNRRNRYSFNKKEKLHYDDEIYSFLSPLYLRGRFSKNIIIKALDYKYYSSFFFFFNRLFFDFKISDHGNDKFYEARAVYETKNTNIYDDELFLNMYINTNNNELSFPIYYYQEYIVRNNIIQGEKELIDFIISVFKSIFFLLYNYLLFFKKKKKKFYYH